MAQIENSPKEIRGTALNVCLMDFNSNHVGAMSSGTVTVDVAIRVNSYFVANYERVAPYQCWHYVDIGTSSYHT